MCRQNLINLLLDASFQKWNARLPFKKKRMIVSICAGQWKMSAGGSVKTGWGLTEQPSSSNESSLCNLALMVRLSPVPLLNRARGVSGLNTSPPPLITHLINTRLLSLYRGSMDALQQLKRASHNTARSIGLALVAAVNIIGTMKAMTGRGRRDGIHCIRR